MTTINSYESAATYLGSKSNRPLTGRSTRLIRIDDKTIAVHYHNTDVVTYSACGKITLDSGGFHSLTTKARFNEYIPGDFRVYQNKNIWYLQSGSWSNVSGTYLYKDGINFNPVRSNKVSGFAPAKNATKQAALRTRINKYAKSYTAALFAGKIDAPSGGDCWYCLMKLGSTTDHLSSHMQESYYVPSLLVRAIEVYPVSTMACYTLSLIWKGEKPTKTSIDSLMQSQIRKSLVKYMLHAYKLA